MSPHKSKLFTHTLKQTAVYWGAPTSDGYGGTTFADPVELAPDNGVRWEDRQEKFIDAHGNEKLSRAIVYVAQDVVLGGYLYLGTMDSLSSGQQADPLIGSLSGSSFEIQAFEKVPDIKGTRFVRKAWVSQ